MEAYCVKCRTRREMSNAMAVTMKNGKPATQGLCSVCGTRCSGSANVKIVSLAIQRLQRPGVADGQTRLAGRQVRTSTVGRCLSSRFVHSACAGRRVKPHALITVFDHPEQLVPGPSHWFLVRSASCD